jgi:ribonuclease J
MSGDTVVMSATPVPGNDTLINRTIDNLFRQGANVIYERLAQVHVHGHASQEELKLLINLVKPKYFVPIHGEYRHLKIHAKLAATVGMPEENIFVMENGDILELEPTKARIAGRIQFDNNVYVDGLVMGNYAGVVLRDRKLLSRDGIVVVIVAINKKNGALIGRPDIVSRGFVDTDDSENILEEGKNIITTALSHSSKYPLDRISINTKVKDTLSKYFFDQTRRRPMILTATIEV